MLSKHLVGIFAAALVGLAGVATAAPFTQISYIATDGTAFVTITATPNGANTNLDIVLTNLHNANDSLSAKDLLTGLQLSPQHIEDYSLTAQSESNDFTFNSDTTGTVGAGSSPNWVLDNSKKALYFGGFGNNGKPLIGGPANNGNAYPNADSSLSSGQHGVDVYQTANFTVLATGTLVATDITGVTFLFNTNGNKPVDGVVAVGNPAPEPASLTVLALGSAALLLRKRRN